MFDGTKYCSKTVGKWGRLQLANSNCHVLRRGEKFQVYIVDLYFLICLQNSVTKDITSSDTIDSWVHSYKKGRDPMIIRATLIKRKNRYSNFHKRLCWEDLPRGGASGKWHWQVWGCHHQKYLLFCWNSKNSKWFPFKRWRFNFI